MSQSFRILSKKILAAMLFEDRWMSKNRRMLEVSLFEEEIRPLAAWVLDHFDRTGEVPDGLTLEIVSEEQGFEFDATFEEIEQEEYQPETLANLLVDSIRVTRVLDLAASAPERIGVGDVDGWLREAREIEAVRSEDSDLTRVRANNLEAWEARNTAAKHDAEKIPTGIPTIDTAIGGGLPKKKVATLLAPASGGKTTTLLNIAAAALRCRKRVLHLTLENTDYEVFQRYGHVLSARAKSLKARGLEQTRALIKKQRLTIAFADYQSIDMAGVEALIEEEVDEASHPFDLIVIDYATAIKYKTGNQDSRWDAVRAIYEQMRAMASRLDVAVWTGHHAKNVQPKRGYFDQEDAVDAKSIWNVVDLGVSQTKTDFSDRTLTADLRIIKSRLGGMHESALCRTDWARGLVMEDGPGSSGVQWQTV